MPIRPTSAGNHQVYYNDLNHLRQTWGTFPNKTLAKDQDKIVQAWLAQGIDPKEFKRKAKQEIENKAITIRTLNEQELASNQTKAGNTRKYSTIKEYRRYVSLTEFADKPVSEVTRQDIDVWFWGLHSRTENQASKAYQRIKSLFTYAIELELIQKNPCKIVGAGNFTPDKPEIIPNPEHANQMEQLATGDFKVILAIAIHGGLRRGEILDLRRGDISREIDPSTGRESVWIDINKAVAYQVGSVAVSGTTKTRKIRKIEIYDLDAGELIWRHLNKLPLNKDSLLFTTDPINNKHWAVRRLDREWNKIRNQVEYTGSFHSLRSYSATQFGLSVDQHGVSPTLIEIMNRFGHDQIKTAMRYQKTTNRHFQAIHKLA
jgi:integrase